MTAETGSTGVAGPVPQAPAYSPNKSRRRDTVKLLCVHWSGGSYASAVDWCLRDESDVSYHFLIGRERGEARLLVPWEYAAWSVGVSAPCDDRAPFTSGNHASENIALSGGPPTPASSWQRAELVRILVERMRAHGWGPSDVWRIVDHAALAMPRGRKPDVSAAGWIQMDALRDAIAKRLTATKAA